MRQERIADLTEAAASKPSAYKIAGSYAVWKEAVQVMIDQGCWTQEIALLAGFAAPLMFHTNAVNGGAVVAFYSPDTGTGKTLGLKAAASIWGP